MQLEVGKKYRTRGGSIVELFYKSKSDRPYSCKVVESNHYLFPVGFCVALRKTGRYIDRYKQHTLDIVEEVTD